VGERVPAIALTLETIARSRGIPRPW
jgi:hypothetical protein